MTQPEDEFDDWHTDSRDVEEPEAVLDEEDAPSSVSFWEQKQRSLLTSAVDYNLSSISSLIKAKQIDLSPKYQRRNRWDVKRKSALIESFLMNVPVPPIFLNEDEYGKYSVIDGKQRLTAIHEFLLGRYALTGLDVFGELNHKTFDDLPSTLQTVLETRANIRALIILRQSDSDIKFEVFNRLNTGGMRLNPQEIRNSAWPGDLNNMILQESTTSEFHSALGIIDRNNSAIYQEMRDAEFVLRYLTFHDVWSTFSGGMGRRMDQYMESNHSMHKDEVDELREKFRSAVRKATAAFGEFAFRRWQPDKRSWRQQVLAAAFDAEIFSADAYEEDALRAHQAILIERLKALFEEAKFRKAVDAGTNTPSFFRERISTIHDMIGEVLKEK
ncbi:DUF262 domain-containing protein [Actinophytocola oryzae]|uniref:Uncharacterized protein DUF262 n=1 Tax=Actinophytocola oryzae TaxID=502181 RepID=A0A4R7VRN2_9PSEU|nr:DUF262 domain-containing protein [Actinophytocola oryzae]TDV52466.1 uncharacterized protein DUF262 [Actinophytocola oryzae]